MVRDLDPEQYLKDVRASLPASRDDERAHQPGLEGEGLIRQKRDDEMNDALSKKTTLILEDLLKDYDKTERPTFKTGEGQM